MAIQNTLIGRLLKSKALPGKKEILRSVGNLAKDTLKNPVKALRNGLARDRLANTAMRAATGKTRGQATKQLGSALAKGIYKGGGKDLAVNVGGAAGSIAGSAGGKVGQLAGDWGGAAVTRKALDDSEALIRASKITKSNRFKNQPLPTKAKLLVRRTLKEAKKNAPGYKKELKQDTTGWAIGNSSADALKSVGSSVPLQGGMVAMGSVPSVMKGTKVALRTKSAKKGLLSTKRSLQKKLSVKRAIKKGLSREDKMYRSVNNELSKLPTLPSGLSFSYPNITFLGSVSNNSKHYYS